ncbi:hypothetical protein B879_03105 [Cecembia lonarensis LW9]|uniref:Uncharacterized protein n=1 Tax=Cecembia lonarensis (strain CCUG 58316 / KCTC 22772 / LW9) TaxID=1225176 RepID=K1LVZ3_CECL9|nr:hypothetical protein B879_03105 [Cecembia lonarensis LW9]
MNIIVKKSDSHCIEPVQAFNRALKLLPLNLYQFKYN